MNAVTAAHQPAEDRYAAMAYRRCGQSGLKLPAVTGGRSLPQMAVAWVLRNPVVAGVAAGASRIEQVEANVAALANLECSADELAAIDALTKPA